MPRLQPSDIWRIPVGVLFLWFAGLAIVRGVGMFGGDVVAIIVGVMGIAIGLLFVGIGAVMALGWVRAK